MRQARSRTSCLTAASPAITQKSPDLKRFREIQSKSLLLCDSITKESERESEGEDKSISGLK